MDFRFSSVLMVVLSTNLVIFATYIIMRNTKLLYRFGFRILSMLLILTGLRMLLPFEFTWISHNIRWPNSISRFVSAYLHERFFHETISLWHITVFIWTAGSLLYLGRYLRLKNKFERFIRRYGEIPAEGSVYAAEFQKIQRENPRARGIKLLFIPRIRVPMVYGIWKPIILLPKNSDIKKEELAFILKHEVSHFIHHDLYVKLGIQCLCMLYWWNPAVFLMKRQADLLLEMQVDSRIAKTPKEKAAYMQCLLKAAKESVNCHVPQSAIPFCSRNTALKERCRLLLNEQPAKGAAALKNSALSAIAFMYILSFVFIIEANYAGPCLYEEGIILPSLENSYMTDNKDGTYNFYLNDRFICVTRSRSHYLDGAAIYRYGEEAILYEK